MTVVKKIEVLDTLLDRWSDTFGADKTAYRNHNYRVANFCIALSDANAEQIEKIGIACAFHDIGVWTVGSLDYLEPSRVLAAEYLAEVGKTAWAPEIEAMVVEHHKLRSAGASAGPLVEPFRKADWIDVSLCALSFGLDRAFLREVREAFPNAGFHKLLMKATAKQLRTDPLHPMPMIRF